MIKDFITYLKSPQDGMIYTFNAKSLLKSVALYVLVVFGVTFAVIVLCAVLSVIFPEQMSSKVIGHSDAPIWIVAFLGPVLEEGEFRLALNRKKVYLAIALIFLTFDLVSSFGFSHRIYTSDHLLIRIGISVVVGSLLTFLLSNFLLRCSFKPYFWFWAIFFGCLHLMNVKYNDLLPLDFITMILYTGTRIVMGLALGYIRMKNSFATSTILHILNNLVTFI